MEKWQNKNGKNRLGQTEYKEMIVWVEKLAGPRPRTGGYRVG
jgi:hypothetical protein